MKFFCYLYFIGGMVGDGIVCDVDDDGIDLFIFWVCLIFIVFEI